MRELTGELVISLFEFVRNDEEIRERIDDSTEFLLTIVYMLSEATGLPSEQIVLYVAPDIIPSGLEKDFKTEPSISRVGIDRDIPDGGIILFNDPRIERYNSMLEAVRRDIEEHNGDGIQDLLTNINSN